MTSHVSTKALTLMYAKQAVKCANKLATNCGKDLVDGWTTVQLEAEVAVKTVVVGVSQDTKAKVWPKGGVVVRP